MRLSIESSYSKELCIDDRWIYGSLGHELSSGLWDPLLDAQGGWQVLKVAIWLRPGPVVFSYFTEKLDESLEDAWMQIGCRWMQMDANGCRCWGHFKGQRVGTSQAWPTLRIGGVSSSAPGPHHWAGWVSPTCRTLGGSGSAIIGMNPM